MKRIVFLSTGLNYGGAETQVVHLASSLSARGWKVNVISMLPPQAYVAELATAGVKVDSLNMHRGFPNPKSVFILASLLRKYQPQILHSHMVHANLLARVTRLIHWMPILISTAHNIDEGGRWREIGYRLTDPICNLTTNVSQAAVARYIQVGAAPKQKIRFIPNGVDTIRFCPDLEARAQLRHELGLGDRFTWLAVGRFEAAKDHLMLTRAFSQLCEHCPDAVLLLVGQGILEDQIREATVSLALSEKVYFLGVRRDIPQLMNAADAYAMSSAWEGLPMVLLEAAAVGCPIVATAVGGNHEAVCDHISGFLVPPRKPEAFAEAMRRMMELRDDERSYMGMTGRYHVQANYSLERVVDNWEELYHACLNH